MKLGEWIKQGLGLAQDELTTRIGELREALHDFGVASKLDWERALDTAISDAHSESHKVGRADDAYALRAIKSCMQKLISATRGK